MEDEREESFPLNDIIKEFVGVFEQCQFNYKNDGDHISENIDVPISVLINAIASSVKVKCFAGTSGDLEDIIQKMLSTNADGNVTNCEKVSKHDFITKITNFINSLHQEFNNCSLNSSNRSNKSVYEFGCNESITSDGVKDLTFGNSETVYSIGDEISDCIRKRLIVDDGDNKIASELQTMCNFSGQQTKHSSLVKCDSLASSITSYCDRSFDKIRQPLQCSKSLTKIKNDCNKFTREYRINEIGDSEEVRSKAADDLVKEKSMLESQCASLQEQLLSAEKAQTALFAEKNTLQFSLNDAAEKEVELQHTIAALQKELKLSKEFNAQMVKRLEDEQDTLRKEKEKNVQLELKLKSFEEQALLTSQQLMASKKEKHLLQQNVDELEKKLELLKSQCDCVTNNVKHWQSQSLSLQQQLDVIISEKNEIELQLKNSVQQLHVVTLQYEDLDTEYKTLKNKECLTSAKEPHHFDESPITTSAPASIPKHLLSCKANNDINKSVSFNCVNKKYMIYTSTPSVNLNKTDSSSINDYSFDFGCDTTPVTTDRAVPGLRQKSLKDEMEEEGEFHCERVGCYSQSSSARSEICPELVQKIEKQQVVINELVEMITEQSIQCGDNKGIKSTETTRLTKTDEVDENKTNNERNNYHQITIDEQNIVTTSHTHRNIPLDENHDDDKYSLTLPLYSLNLSSSTSEDGAESVASTFSDKSCELLPSRDNNVFTHNIQNEIFTSSTNSSFSTKYNFPNDFEVSNTENCNDNNISSGDDNDDHSDNGILDSTTDLAFITAPLDDISYQLSPRFTYHNHNYEDHNEDKINNNTASNDNFHVDEFLFQPRDVFTLRSSNRCSKMTDDINPHLEEDLHCGALSSPKLVSVLQTKCHYDNYNKTRSALLVADEDLSRSPVKIVTEVDMQQTLQKKRRWPRRNAFITAAAVGLFSVSTLSFIMQQCINNFYGDDNYGYRPIGYYGLEELIQPYIGVRWEHPPPI